MSSGCDLHIGKGMLTLLHLEARFAAILELKWRK